MSETPEWTDSKCGFHTQGTMRYQTVWCIWEWCKSYAMAFVFTTVQPRLTSMGALDVRQHPPPPSSKQLWNIFCKNGVPTSGRVPKTCTSCSVTLCSTENLLIIQYLSTKNLILQSKPLQYPVHWGSSCWWRSLLCHLEMDVMCIVHFCLSWFHMKH